MIRPLPGILINSGITHLRGSRSQRPPHPLDENAEDSVFQIKQDGNLKNQYSKEIGLQAVQGAN